MRKILKIVGLTAAGLVGLLVVLVLILKLIPDSQYRSWITSAVKSSTGRDFSIQALELDLGSSVSFSADGIKMANADWAQTGDMLNVNHLEAELSLWPLLSGKADIRAVLDTAELIAQGDENGVSNWDLSAGKPPDDAMQEAVQESEASSGLPIRPIIRELRLENVKLTKIAGPDEEPEYAFLNHLRILTPESETTLLLKADVNGIPIQLDGNLGNLERALDQISTPVTLEGQFDQNQLKILGEWGPILPETNLDLEIDIKIPSTSAVAAIAGFDVGDFGELEINAHLTATEGIMAIDDIVTRLDGEKATSSLDGSVANLLSLDGVDIGIQIDTQTLNEIVKILKIELPVPLPPEVHISAKLQGGQKGLSLNDINAVARDEGLHVALTGEVNHLLTGFQVDGQFQGTIDSLSRFSKYADMELPGLGVLTLSGNVLSAGETIGLSSLDARLSADNLNLNLKGGVNDLLTVSGIDAQADLDIASLTEQNIKELTTFLKSFEVELPVDLLPRSARLSTAVKGDLELLSLGNIEAELKDQGINIALSGEVANALKPEGVLANIKLNSDSIASFSKYAGTELPDLGPLDASAKVVSSENSYSLESLQAMLMAETLKAKINASVKDLLAVTGIDAELSADTETLAALSGLANTELPDTDPVKVLATLAAESLEQADVTVMATTAGAKVDASSALSLRDITNNLTLSITVEAETLTDFNKLAQQELPDEGPLKLSSSINIQPRNFTLSDLNLLLAEDQSATGNLKLQLPEPGGDQGVTTLTGKLDISHLDLSPLLPEELSEEELAELAAMEEANMKEIADEVGSETKKVAEEELFEREQVSDEPLDPSERLLPSEPFVYDKLHNYDIDLAINASRLDMGEARIQDIELAVTLHDGLLNISPIQATGVEVGELVGSLVLDGRQSIPTLDTTITLTQFPTPNVGGEMDLHVNIDGRGQSVADLMASLNGQILMVLKDGVISKSFVSRFGKGLLSFSGDNKNTNIECAILRVDIVDGVADFERKLAAQLTEVTWRGGGSVDFNTERIKADIVPKPRKGIPINVGGSLAGLVSLTGTLKNPRIAPDFSDAAIKYGKYSAYIATGGLSLLAEIVANKVRANQDVCEKILDGTVFSDDEKATKKDNPPR